MSRPFRGFSPGAHGGGSGGSYGRSVSGGSGGGGGGWPRRGDSSQSTARGRQPYGGSSGGAFSRDAGAGGSDRARSSGRAGDARRDSSSGGRRVERRPALPGGGGRASSHGPGGRREGAGRRHSSGGPGTGRSGVSRDAPRGRHDRFDIDLTHDDSDDHSFGDDDDDEDDGRYPGPQSGQYGNRSDDDEDDGSDSRMVKGGRAAFSQGRVVELVRGRGRDATPANAPSVAVGSRGRSLGAPSHAYSQSHGDGGVADRGREWGRDRDREMDRERDRDRDRDRDRAPRSRTAGPGDRGRDRAYDGGVAVSAADTSRRAGSGSGSGFNGHTSSGAGAGAGSAAGAGAGSSGSDEPEDAVPWAVISAIDRVRSSREAALAAAAAATQQAEEAEAGTGAGAGAAGGLHSEGASASAAAAAAAAAAIAPPVPGSAAAASPSPVALPFASPLLALHAEVLHFARFIAPSPLEAGIADAALASVRSVLLSKFPSARMDIFGSRASGLVLPTSDWDVVLFGVPPTKDNMYALSRALTAAGAASKVEVIASARVPIVKVKERLSGISIDICFDVASGLATRALIADFLRRYPPVRPLVLVLKYFLMQRGLHETYTGGVGSFLLVLMTVHVVQRALLAAEKAAAADASAATARKSTGRASGAGAGAAAGASAASGGAVKRGRDVDNVDVDGDDGDDGDAAAARDAAACSRLNLGALLLSFFELYGFALNYNAVGISVLGRYGGYFSKARRGWSDPARPFLLSMENPVDRTHDVARNSYSIARARRAFAHAHTALSRALRLWQTRADAAVAVSTSASASARANSGAGTSAGRRSGSSSSASASALPPAPASLLVAAVHADPLLQLRAVELELAAAQDMEGERAALEEILRAQENDSDVDDGDAIDDDVDADGGKGGLSDAEEGEERDDDHAEADAGAGAGAHASRSASASLRRSGSGRSVQAAVPALVPAARIKGGHGLTVHGWDSDDSDSGAADAQEALLTGASPRESASPAAQGGEPVDPASSEAPAANPPPAKRARVQDDNVDARVAEADVRAAAAAADVDFFTLISRSASAKDGTDASALTSELPQHPSVISVGGAMVAADAEPERVEAAAQSAMELLSSSGLQLRNPKRLADIFTRRERKVDELAAQMSSWY